MSESSAGSRPAFATASHPEHRAAPHHVLLVDDEPAVLQGMRRQLLHEPYRLSFTTSGDAALALLERDPADVVVTDNRMPGMDGVRLLEQVRERWPDTVRIMVTGHADTAEVLQALLGGALYRFILKPVQPDDLRLTLTLAAAQSDLLRERRVPGTPEPTKAHAALERHCCPSPSRLPRLLVQHGLLDESSARRVRREQLRHRTSTIRALVVAAGARPDQMVRVLERELGLEPVALHTELVAPEVIRLLPRSFCARHDVLPLRREGARRLVLAMADPTDTTVLDNLHFVTGLHVEPLLAPLDALEAKLHALYGGADDEPESGDLTHLVEHDDAEAVEVVIDEAEALHSPEVLASAGEPVIRTVNAILCEAADLGASDVHVQPGAAHALVRYRVDGVLVDKFRVPLELHRALVSRVKVLAALDIAERRRPQDGRITLKLPAKVVDVRISTLPTATGEQLVMRLLDRHAAIQSLDALGFAPPLLARVLEIADRPQGLFLATGPTGSGKTTTLYALLQQNASQERHYVTIEDPVEYTMPAAAQVAVHDRLGLGFANALRAVLRQDPDVILLGEIRDAETAAVAFHAAMTGHKVYSTLHTNSSVEALTRLRELGLDRHLIGAALDGILSQRLVRRVCPECREATSADPALLERLGWAEHTGAFEFSRGRGCAHCAHTGYRGRAPLHELLVMDEEVAAMFADGRSAHEITRTLTERGWPLLADDAFDKVRKGVTTPGEILRVLGPAASRRAAGPGAQCPPSSRTNGRLMPPEGPNARSR